MKAPQIQNLVLEKLAANYAKFTWDDLGNNVLYRIDYFKNNKWVLLPLLIKAAEYFFTGLEKNTKYKIRIYSIISGYEILDPVEFEEFETFSTNLYSITKLPNLTLSSNLIFNKFVNGNNDYLNFNTELLMAALMDSRFQYDPSIEYMSLYSNNVVKQPEYHTIFDEIDKICKDVSRVCPAYINGTIYLFEKFQHISHISNNNTKSWYTYSALPGRAGNPVTNTICYQSDNITFVLGYDSIYAARNPNNVRWSSNIDRFSSKVISFVPTKLENLTDVGFPVAQFNTFIKNPDILQHKIEALASSEKYLYVAGRNTLKRVSIYDADRESDIDSPNFDKRIWESSNIQITNNKYAVCKKMDVLNNKLYVLVTGVAGNSKVGYLDPTNKNNITDDQCKGIYVLDDDTLKFTKVFGNTDDELKTITHTLTNMSTNGKELFFDCDNFTYDMVVDTELPVKNSKVSFAVKYKTTETYALDKFRHLITFRTNGALDSGITWYYGPLQYYCETRYSWMYNENIKIWINHLNKLVIVFPGKEYIIDLDIPKKSKEVWSSGDCLVYCNKIKFSDVTQYLTGILIYGKYLNKIVGFYKFDFLLLSKILLEFQDDIMFIANLDNNLLESNNEITPELYEVTPNITPLMSKMAPDSYLLDQELYTKFIFYYLQFISTKTTSHYNRLVNFIKNKYPREQESIDFLWSELGKRNIYLNKDKKMDVIKFFETRASDFYLSKGTINSYKFLFKLLYNEDIDIEVESEQLIEYNVTISSNNILQDILGTTVYTATGRANVLDYQKTLINGQTKWILSVHNIYGKFIAGQVLLSKTVNFEGMLETSLTGKIIQPGQDNIPLYSTIKITLRLPVNKYKDDVLRFVHPTGYGFVGILLITMYINNGISIQHSETIIELMKTFRWDAGVPLRYPEKIPDLSKTGELQLNDKFEILEKDNPLKDIDPIINWPNYDIEEDMYFGTLPSERRSLNSPIFDASWVRFSNFLKNDASRLKDNIGNPRDPKNPTQVKIDKA